MPLLCSIRPILPEDVLALVEIDAAWNRYHDADLELEVTPPWSLDGDGLMDFIRQYESDRVRDTRVYVVERPVPEPQEGGPSLELVGGFGYLVGDDEYDLAFVAVRDDAFLQDFVSAVADFFRKKSSGSGRSVRLVLRDTHRNVSRMWPAWRSQGYGIRLSPDRFEGTDGPQDGWVIGPKQSPQKKQRVKSTTED